MINIILGKKKGYIPSETQSEPTKGHYETILTEIKYKNHGNIFWFSHNKRLKTHPKCHDQIGRRQHKLTDTK